MLAPYRRWAVPGARAHPGAYGEQRDDGGCRAGTSPAARPTTGATMIYTGGTNPFAVALGTLALLVLVGVAVWLAAAMRRH
ncbi:MAG: hypothetical protein ACYCYA_06180 [Actinomycetes bacterium]